jgi:hypothetical protein
MTFPPPAADPACEGSGRPGVSPPACLRGTRHLHGSRQELRRSASAAARFSLQAAERDRVPRPARTVAAEGANVPHQTAAEMCYASGTRIYPSIRQAKSPDWTQIRGWPAQCPGVPLHRQGHPKIISNRFAEMISRTHP